MARSVTSANPYTFKSGALAGLTFTSERSVRNARLALKAGVSRETVATELTKPARERTQTRGLLSRKQQDNIQTIGASKNFRKQVRVGPAEADFGRKPTPRPEALLKALKMTGTSKHVIVGMHTDGGGSGGRAGWTGQRMERRSVEMMLNEAIENIEDGAELEDAMTEVAQEMRGEFVTGVNAWTFAAAPEEKE